MSEPQLDVTNEVTEEDNSVEAIAREAGWSPKEEWKGKEDDWKEASEFVKTGIKIQKNQADTIGRMQTTISNVEKNIQSMAKSEAQRTRKALEAQRTRLEEERQEAFESSDAKKFNEIDRELKETDQQLESPEAEDAFVVGEEEFRKRNGWYGDDKLMTAHVLTMAQNLKGAFPEIDPDEYYETLEKDAKKQFPEAFQNENRNKGSIVAGDAPSRVNGGSSNKGFDSLPPEAKEAYGELIHYTSLTKKDYAKSYFESESE